MTDDEYVRCIACGNPLDEEYHAARGTDVIPTDDITLTDDERNDLDESWQAGFNHGLYQTVERMFAPRVAKITVDLWLCQDELQAASDRHGTTLAKYDALVEAMRALADEGRDEPHADHGGGNGENVLVCPKCWADGLDAALPPTKEPT